MFDRCTVANITTVVSGRNVWSMLEPTETTLKRCVYLFLHSSKSLFLFFSFLQFITISFDEYLVHLSQEVGCFFVFCFSNYCGGY